MKLPDRPVFILFYFVIMYLVVFGRPAGHPVDCPKEDQSARLYISTIGAENLGLTKI